MASRSFAALHKSGRRTLDVPVAALAGLSVAVVAFAMPGDLLAGLVRASGLPSILSAAEPPLGFKARIGLGAAGAVAIFVVTFLLLRWLENFGGGRRAARREEEEELTLEVEAPRLRRRDIHPDAPARPPLLAAHELGEPDLDFEPPAVDPYAAWPAPAPAPAPEPPAAVQPAPAPEPKPVPEQDETEDAPADKFDRQAEAYALSQSRWVDDYVPQPPAEPEIEAPSPVEPPASAEPDDMAGQAGSEPPAPAVASEAEPRIATASPWSPPEASGEQSPPPAERPQPGSIADLMDRLEQGLARRRGAPEPATEPVAEAPAPALPPADNDRLQSAIDSLQRFASRQD